MYQHIIAQRRREELALAEEERLIRLSRRRSVPSVRRHQRWLARLGAQMVAWGRRLEILYGDPLELSMAVCTDCRGNGWRTPRTRY
jgi:hypothetical protein